MAKPKEPLMRDELLRIAQNIIKINSDQRVRDHYALVKQGLTDAITLVLSPEIKGVLTHPIFDKIPPYEIFEHFTRTGWPLPDDRTLWIESPAFLAPPANKAKNGILVSKPAGQPRFDLSIFLQGKVNGFIEGHERKPFFSIVKTAGLWDMVYSLCPISQEVISHMPIASFASFGDNKALVTDTDTEKHMATSFFATKEDQKHIKTVIKKEHHQTALLLLRLFLVMSKAGPNLSNAQSQQGPKQISLGQKFFSGFNELKGADDLRRFFGLPDQAEMDGLPIIHRVKSFICPDNEKTDPAEAEKLFKEAKESPIILYDESFRALASKLAGTAELEELRAILKETGVPFSKFWFEGPYLGLPHGLDANDPFVRRVGCFVQHDDSGLSLQFALTDRATVPHKPDQVLRVDPKQAGIPVTIVNIIRGNQFFPFNEPLIIEEETEQEGKKTNTLLQFLTAGLILTRMRQINLEEAGLLAPSKRTARQSNDEKTVRFKFPYIGQQKDKDDPAVIDVTKPNSGKSSSSNDPFVLSQESIAWEEAKTHARELVGDVLNEENHGQLFLLLDKTAKEMFGANVTVAISRVQESKVMYGRVSGVPYRYPEHIRIDLVYERDGHYGELRQAAYLLTAKSASQDGRQLELSVRGGNVTLKPKSSDLGMT